MSHEPPAAPKMRVLCGVTLPQDLAWQLIGEAKESQVTVRELMLRKLVVPYGQRFVPRVLGPHHN